MAVRYDFVEVELERRAAEQQLRRLRAVAPLGGATVSLDGRPVIDFSSNDYLGLSAHPLLQRRAAELARAHGAGARASRLATGNHPGFSAVERKLAVLKHTESALVLTSGYQANVSLLPALADRHSLILSDRLNHRSLVQGAQLSRCKVQRYRHGDLAHLQQLLERSREQAHSRVLIVTETVFSMDGDQTNVEVLARLAREHGAFLVLDEAHATGVLGERGMGLSCGQPVDLTMGTFSKAGGSFGAYVACSARLAEYIVNCCAGFVYSTALPPAVLGAIDAALELIPQMDEARAELHRKADFVRGAVAALGWSTGTSTTQIVPVIVGPAAAAVDLSAWLEEKGVLALPMRPPTVEPGRSRLRLGLSVLHTWEHLETLVDLCRGWRDRQG